MTGREGNIELTITDLEDRKQKLGDQISKIDLCIETLKLVAFGDNRPAETKKQKPPQPAPAKNKVERKHIAGLRGPRKQASKYKGVSLTNTKRDGTFKYRVQFWDGPKKKNIQLGAYDSELEAAAVYQEHVGNKAEAKRLRSLDKQQAADMSEQAENNPDRPMDGADRSKAKKTGKTIWVCKRCGLEYQSKGVCAQCDNDDMREVPADKS